MFISFDQSEYSCPGFALNNQLQNFWLESRSLENYDD